MAAQRDGMGQPMITHEDLQWWLDLAPQLSWIYAKTYAKTAPHSYVVAGRTAGMSREDYVRAGRVIHTYGQPGKFHDYTNIYLVSPDGRYKWWTMDAKVEDTDLINMATTDKVYGKQDAPVTHSGIASPFDLIATEYDTTRDASGDAAVRRRVIDHFGAYAPRTLDVGCGTGALLDLGVVSPRLYTGIDSSQAMLNQLVRKYPKVNRLIPSRFEDVDMDLDLESYELVVAMNVPGLDERRLRQVHSELLIITGGEA